MRRRHVETLSPGDVIAWPIDRLDHHDISVPKRVVEVREVPEVDRTDADRLHARPPHYLTITGLDGGEREHYEVAGNDWGFTVMGEHFGICATCGQINPCRDQLIDRAVKMQQYAMENKCCVCHKPLGWRIGELLVDTPEGQVVQRYHTVKGSKCRRAYTLAAARDPEALERLRAEDEGRPYTPLKKPQADGGVTS